MDIQTVLLLHVATSFMALPLGLVAIKALFAPTPALWTGWFLALAVATILTGFLFPIPALTPATVVGFLGTLVLIAMAVARTALAGQVLGRRLYALGLVVSTWFLAFVLVAQAYLKLPPLKAIAPTGTEWPFAVTELVVLLVFGWIGFRVFRRIV